MYWSPVYTLKLVNDKTRFYRKLSWFVIFINIILFIYLALFAELKDIRLSGITCLIVLFLYYAVKYFFFREKLMDEHGIFSVYTIIYVTYIIIGWYWMAGIMALLSILFSIATRDLLVIIFNDRVKLPFREIKWDAISNMLLKDGILTIDMKNNKILQELVDDKDGSIDEKEFNEFCRQQLK